MDINQISMMNQAKLNMVGNTIIQGGVPRSHGDVYAVRQNRYRDELDQQIAKKNQMKYTNKLNDWTMDNMHLDTISYAPVGNPNVSSRRSQAGHFQTSYNNQYVAPEMEANKLDHSQSQQVIFG